jgi:riboflavin transporter FmnP
MTNNRTKKIVTLAMLCAMAYTVMFALRSPPLVEIPPLKYDPKDVIILLGGFIYGPLSAAAVSVVVSVLEMITVSTTGIWGCVMNIVSSCAFVCTASIIYGRRKTLGGAIIGMTVGVIAVTGVMTLWNYIVVPFYAGYPRAAVAKMLVPVFIPFNLFKYSVSAVLTMLLFKPVATALYKSDLIEPPIIGKRSTKAKWVFIYTGAFVSAAILFYSFDPLKIEVKKTTQGISAVEPSLITGLINED